MENLTGGTPPVRYLPCVVPCKLYFCENETNLKVIQSVMGHKDIQTTMDVYAEATEQKKQESFERLAAKLDIF